MADNTTLNVGAGGDVIRDIQRQSGTPKTQVVALDLGGVESNPEFLIAAGQAPMAQSLSFTLAGDQPSDPNLQNIASLLSTFLQLYPGQNQVGIFSAFGELIQTLRSLLSVKTVSANNIATGQVSVLSSAPATLIVPPIIGATDVTITIKNTGSGTVFLGNASVSAANGHQLDAAASLSTYTIAPIYGIAGTGTQVVTYWQTYW